jgi:hypothetical protein
MTMVLEEGGGAGEVKEQDTVVLDLETGKIREFIKVGGRC